MINSFSSANLETQHGMIRKLKVKDCWFVRICYQLIDIVYSLELMIWFVWNFDSYYTDYFKKLL